MSVMRADGLPAKSWLKVVGRVGSNSLTMRAEARNWRLKCDSLASDQTMTLGWLWWESTIADVGVSVAKRLVGLSSVPPTQQNGASTSTYIPSRSAASSNSAVGG